ncbi:MAG TPA: zinc ribbon domain-containing protein [Polyangia bacterium]|nr:zinc ribbon domain-containing protein [Polyangia bacterium]
MTFDPRAGALACSYCGARKQAAAPTGALVVEHELSEGLALAAPRGLGVAVKTIRCTECGAEVQLEPQVTATRCTFCGSPSVLAAEAAEEPIRPESVLAFRCDRPAALESYRGWLARLWLRPSDLKSKAALEEIAGVYVPFWTFDCAVASSWSADSGYFYYTTETYTDTENGQSVERTREVQHVRWEPASGARNDSYDDLLVCGSRGLPQGLAQKLHTFDTSALQPYSPDYLAGFRAEKYAIDLPEAFQRALVQVEHEQQRRCAGDVPGDTQRGLQVSSTVSNVTFKHVLLPLWIAAYRYGGKVYRFVVNGQTGEVQGSAPYSVAKIALLVLVVLLVLLALAASGHR